MRKTTGKKDTAVNIAGKRAAAALCAVIAMAALAACAPAEGQPTVTSDDLTPAGAAQTALEQEAGGGMNYPYEWLAEDVEGAIAGMRQEYERMLAAYMAEEDAEERAMAEGYDSLEDMQEGSAQWFEEEIKLQRESMEKEAALAPAVSAQEAANIAGSMFMKMYGVDTTTQPVELHCYESDANMSYHAAGGGIVRKVWSISREEPADGMLFSGASVSCTMDADTGEIITVYYTPYADEVASMQATPRASCVDGSGYNWNEAEPSYAQAVETMKQQVQTALSGSTLTGGAQVTEVRVQLMEYKGDGSNALFLYADCDNGRTYRLERQKFSVGYCSFDFSGYPLRAFWLTNDTYLQK